MIYFMLPLAMLFIHVMIDFNQGDTIALMKQKSWWLNYSDYKDSYEDDYKVVLLAHGFSWSFAIHIPLFIFQLLRDSPQYYDEIIITVLLVSIIINGFIHSFVDDLKANKKKINLFQDQALHFLQILFTWGVFILFKVLLLFNIIGE